MKRLKTIRFRFAFWTSSLLFLTLCIFGVFVYGSMQSGLYSALDYSLMANADQIAAGLNIENGQLHLPDNLVETQENTDLRGRGFTLRVLTPQGKLIQSNGPYHDLPLSSNGSFLTYSLPNGGAPIRIYTQYVMDNNRLIAIVQVAQSIADIQITLRKLLLSLLISTPILMIIAAVSGYFLAARALTPIDEIISTARRISAEDLSQRLDLAVTDDEVGRLVSTLNEMFARLDDSFQRERQFTNDASHELRTPLAAMQAILSVIRSRRRTSEEYEQALDDLSEETERLHTLVENLLRLARGNKRTSPPFAKVNLSQLIQDVVDSLRPLAEQKNLTITSILQDNLVMMGDSDELVRLLVNLMDNAIKYTEKGFIIVNAIEQDKEIIIKVRDSGVGIEEAHLAHIFDRFYQVDRARSGRGAGLGLAIAKEIVRLHSGTIKVESQKEIGTTFTIIFPKYN